VLCVAADEEEKEAVEVDAHEYRSPPPRLGPAALPPPPSSWWHGLRNDGRLSSLGRRGRHPHPASTTGT